MKFKLISIGHKMPDWVQAGFEQYQKRLLATNSFSLHEIPLQKRQKSGNNESSIAKETEMMINALSKDGLVIALERTGTQLSSESLSQKLTEWQNNYSCIDFLIGGPEGFNKDIFQHVHYKWSLSELTLPHPLARVVFIEQLYRAQCIATNHPYHK